MIRVRNGQPNGIAIAQIGSFEFKRFVADKIFARHGEYDFVQRCNLRYLLNGIVVTMRQEKDNVIDAKMHEPCSQLSVGATNFGASFFISGILAIVFKTMTAPLERIKLILQTQASSHQIAKSEDRKSVV